MAEEPTATARFRAELTGAWAEFLASLFFVFFGAGSVCGAVKAVGEPVVVEPVGQVDVQHLGRAQALGRAMAHQPLPRPVDVFRQDLGGGHGLAVHCARAVLH